MESTFQKIIQDICNENNISYKVLSKEWVIMLEKDDKTTFISGHKFDLNPHGIGLIADDKYALFEVLHNKKIPVISHSIVYNKTNKMKCAIGCNSHEYVKDFFKNNGNHIVLKPNDGTCGKDVYNITDIEQIAPILDKLFTKNFSICMCPFYSIKHEYRAIMLNGECKLLYAKYLPVVIGDGINSIRQLLIDFNHDYFINKLNDPTYDRILAKGEKFEYNWKFNLSQGSVAKKVNDSVLSNQIIELAQKVCKEINLKFGSVDIIQTIDNKLFVLEVNSGVMLENYVRLYPNEYNTAKAIYKSAIDTLFE